MSAAKRDPRQKAIDLYRALYSDPRAVRCAPCGVRNDLIDSAHLHRREVVGYDRQRGRVRTIRSRRRYWTDEQLLTLSAAAQSTADFYLAAAALADGSGHPEHAGSVLLKAATDGR